MTLYVNSMFLSYLCFFEILYNDLRLVMNCWDYWNGVLIVLVENWGNLQLNEEPKLLK